MTDKQNLLLPPAFMARVFGQIVPLGLVSPVKSDLLSAATRTTAESCDPEFLNVETQMLKLRLFRLYSPLLHNAWLHHTSEPQPLVTKETTPANIQAAREVVLNNRLLRDLIWKAADPKVGIITYLQESKEFEAASEVVDYFFMEVFIPTFDALYPSRYAVPSGAQAWWEELDSSLHPEELVTSPGRRLEHQRNALSAILFVFETMLEPDNLEQLTIKPCETFGAQLLNQIIHGTEQKELRNRRRRRKAS